MASSGKAINGLQIMTPNTNSDSSPPEKLSSPRTTSKRTYDEMKRGSNGLNNNDGASTRPSKALTPIQTPPDSLPAPSDPRPPAGKIRALKCRYDPNDDSKAGKLKPTYVAFGEDLRTHGIRERGYVMMGKESAKVKANDTLVADIKNDSTIKPPDPRLALAGYTEGAWYQEGKPGKSRPKKALRITKPFGADPATSIGRGPATQVVVYGFDPLTDVRQIRVLLETYGTIARMENRQDAYGGNFGVCSVTFMDKQTKYEQIKAEDAALNAEKNGTGQKIGFKTVRIECDPIGARAKRICRRITENKQRQREKADELQTNRVPSVSSGPPAGPASLSAPFNAPKGPSNRVGGAPPTGPAVRPAAIPTAPATKAPRDSHKVETTSILPSLGTKPYNFLAAAHVPVMGSVIDHLEKRMKSYNWEQIRCDSSGYYVVFAETPYGRQECERCHKECDGRALFTYTMHLMMRSQGNVTHEINSGAPAVKKPVPIESGTMGKKRLWEDDKADFEEEKKQKAERLDPVHGAIEDLTTKILAHLLEDLKKKYTAPTVYEKLDPDLHKERREKHGIADPNEKQRGIFGVTDSNILNNLQNSAKTLPGTISSTFTSRTWRRSDAPKKSLGVNGRQQAPHAVSSADPYADERRKNPRKPRAPAPARRLQDMLQLDQDSDDDSHTVVTRGSGDADSRAVSEIPASPAHFPTDPGIVPNNLKRKRVEKPDDDDVAYIKLHLPHLAGKDPEDMALRELQQIVSAVPRTSALRQRALNEVSFRKQKEADDALFGIREQPATMSTELSTQLPDDTESFSTPEPVLEVAPTGKKKGKAAPKPKKKTKKQLQEEQEIAAKEAEAKASLLEALEQDEAATPLPEDLEEEEQEPEEDVRADVEWSVSTDMPRRTVEDDPDLLLDMDGWQHTIKDDEDLRFLQFALVDTKPAPIQNPNLWSWNQKQIKALNNGGKWNVTNHGPELNGYYRPNPSGSARTEPVTKILNSEKNNYLPHRIKVREAREAREAAEALGAKPATIEATKAAAAVKLAGKVNSRAARADNRRQFTAAALATKDFGTSGDVAYSINQLKKRKKQVRFDRSAIHNWGLYAEENIGANEMIIEYVGEVVRQKVADIREVRYDAQGVGSSYLFRCHEDRIVDATKKGGIARFINHSCNPSCTARIITVTGTQRIVIYALRDILKNEELTYDYKFEREINSEDRIPCLCGADNCKGFLN